MSDSEKSWLEAIAEHKRRSLGTGKSWNGIQTRKPPSLNFEQRSGKRAKGSLGISETPKESSATPNTRPPSRKVFARLSITRQR
jgi:hypothetical protein